MSDMIVMRHGQRGWEIRQEGSHPRANLLVRWLDQEPGYDHDKLYELEVGREGSGVGGINPLRSLSSEDSFWLARACQTAFDHQIKGNPNPKKD